MAYRMCCSKLKYSNFDTNTIQSTIPYTALIGELDEVSNLHLPSIRKPITKEKLLEALVETEA